MLVMLLTVALTACGSKQNAAGSKNGKVTIQFMTSSVEHSRIVVMNKLIKQFEKANPNITVKVIPVQEGSYNTKITTLANSGQLPAVIEVGQDYARVMDSEKLIDHNAVDKVINDIGKNNYYSGALKLLGTEQKNTYSGVPMSGWVQGIWYNKKMLASKGFSEPKSWADVLKIAKAFTDPAKKKYGIALPTAESPFSQQSFSQFALSNNANVLDKNGNLTINTKAMKQALVFYKKLSKYTMRGSNDVTQVKDAFMNGQAPMAVYSTYILPSVYQNGDPSNIGFAIPTNKSQAVYGSVSAYTITSGLDSAHKQAAEKFVGFMSQPKNETKLVLMAPGGAQPVNKKVAGSKAYQNNKVVKAFGSLSKEVAQSFNKVQVFGLVDGKNFTKMGNITSSGAIPKMINGVTVGGENVNSAIQTAKSAIEQVMNK